MDITFTVSESQKSRVIDAVKGIWPVPLSSTGEPLYSDGAWAKERIRRMIINAVHAYETRVATNQVIKDDSLVT